MVMDFAALPPEITSTLVWSGPGSAPLMAAATAYANLAAEVSTTATSWESIISLLTTEAWTGGGSAAAATAAQPIVTYLTDTATALEQASSAAASSAAAFEAAHAGVVNPALVFTNRAEFTAALAGLPFTLPQVTELEMEYSEMWVQDATAMSAYQAASDAAAGMLQPVTPLASTVDPAVQAADAPVQAADLAAPQALQALDLSSLTDALQLPFTSNNLLQSIDGFLGTPSVLNAINGAVNTAAWFTMITIPTAVSLGHVLAGAAVPAAAVSDVVPAGAGGVIEGAVVSSVSPMAGAGGLGSAATASLGGAQTVSRLSVPASWAANAAPATELAAATAPIEGSGWTAATEEASVMGAPGMPGMVAGAKGAGAFGSGPRYGFKPIVMPKQVVV
ncbi:PPE family protein [Mycobacterium lentiflavum]|jgi:PPE-repeat protein|uniref:PPE family protein n=1 Tax=Mycobacterium lentiflavum TaxID=141349 RepID=A0A0E3WDH6_MYCLN|nr:PPE domain-containing protein [Mycobacterium lentiflavum]MEE3066095.1 PPE domain-containing protein [Actinomycetota bacterium]ULP41450.1 PPE family protein [Mycobacterium lentiflavum]CQD19935.1 PPE family protein [Mycobacterium lentiflavum]